MSWNQSVVKVNLRTVTYFSARAPSNISLIEFWCIIAELRIFVSSLKRFSFMSVWKYIKRILVNECFWYSTKLKYKYVTFANYTCYIVTYFWRRINLYYSTRWFKYDWDKLWLVYTQIVPVIFEPPCIIIIIPYLLTVIDPVAKNTVF